MELYRFKLTPARRKAKLNFSCIENDFSLFSLAANNCNQGVSFKRDGKKIIIDEITDTYLIITLQSSAPLHAPTRTLSALSRELLRLDKSSNVLSESVYNHTLFSTEPLPNIVYNNKKIEDIPDSEYLKTFFDLIGNDIIKANYSKELNEIKTILLKIISLQ